MPDEAFERDLESNNGLTYSQNHMGPRFVSGFAAGRDFITGVMILACSYDF